MIRILFTCIGRRVELITLFKKSSTFFHRVKIYGVDCSETAPASYFCDRFLISPKITDNNYIHFIYDFCRKENIDLVIPTIDTDLEVLSLYKNEFLKIKCRILISDNDFIKKCNDKKLTMEIFKKASVNFPMVYEKDDSILLPAFIKPSNGSSSINAFKINNELELNFFKNYIPNPLIQEYISGQEYTVDILCDFSGNPISIVPRKRLKIRSGEVIKTQIDLDETIIFECKKIIEVVKPTGPLTIQLIKKIDNSNWYIEINPRFGGGSPLSILAGANSPKQILRMLKNKKPNRKQIVINNAIYCRYDQSIKF